MTFFLLLIIIVSNLSSGDSEKHIQNAIFEAVNNETEFYDRFQPPSDELTEVRIAFDVSDVSEIDDHRHSILAKVTIFMQWQDSRLVMKNTHGNLHGFHNLGK